MWFKESNKYCCKNQIIAYGEINERRFSNHHPWSSVAPTVDEYVKRMPNFAMGMDYKVKSILNSMLVNKDFLT